MKLIQFKVDICDPNLGENDWPVGSVTTNTKLEYGIGQYRLTNATSLKQCARECCEKLDCNLAFFKEMQSCYLVTCTDEDSCKPVYNQRKSKADPLDYMVKIRSIGLTFISILFKSII